MAISKGRADAGQGGKRGHSNMDHWEFTEEIKLAAEKRRRLEAKRQIQNAVGEYLQANVPSAFKESREK
jgi:hypothetical protein